ncbi:hypothetical protein [Actinomadura parmotrematis]|uniref:Uncharacterized protein n=1 Tax=Actinomadura parmotrematis TaxID=2864039 RepID=A0ABS7FWI1_9ACTN|nr:hypothetical protein [Actinomadura parmotrematis]MBW8484790.1 hypothetical protein [Actinomadura parmotrematis]
MSDPYLSEVRWSGTELLVRGRVGAAGAAPPAELLLRERGGARVFTAPLSTEEAGGDLRFRAALDVASIAGGPLPHGVWDVELGAGGRGVPLGRDRDAGLETEPQRRFLPGDGTAVVYFGVRGTLAVDVGGEPHAAGEVRAEALAWNAGAEELVVRGRVRYDDLPSPVSATLALRESAKGRVYEVIAALEEEAGGLAYTASIPLTRAFIDDPLPRGVWDAVLVLGFSGMHREMRVMAPPDGVDLQVWRRLRHVRVATSVAPDPLRVSVGRPG